MKSVKQILALIVMLFLCAAGFSQDFGISKMVSIPDLGIEILNTEVTQMLYQSVMGENPGKFKGEYNPVESVSWYDAIYFCNKLSEMLGYTPVYELDGSSDVTKWNYTAQEENGRRITKKANANGFRLPTRDEWQKSAKGGKWYSYAYAGSDDIDEVAWYTNNSGETQHPVAQKKPNAYGLFDMSGNVMEWVQIDEDDYIQFYRGGSYYLGDCKITAGDYDGANDSGSNLGFRIARTIK